MEQQARAGKIKLIAFATPQRNPSHPDVPTITESGVPEFETGTWFGVLGPSGIPREIVEQIHQAMSKLIAPLAFAVSILRSSRSRRSIFPSGNSTT